MPFGNTQELVQSRIKLGLSQNIAYVNANSAELAAGIGVPPNIPNPGAPPGAQARQPRTRATQQAMQMMMQMGQMAAQLPQQIGGMLTQAPQQLDAAVATTHAAAAAADGDVRRQGRFRWSGTVTLLVVLQSSPRRRVRRGRRWRHGACGVDCPARVGVALQTPLMASLAGSHPAGVAPGPVLAGSGAVGGVAPVAAGGAGMGGMGMMGHRGESGGTAASLAMPTPLEYDQDDDVDDEW